MALDIKTTVSKADTGLISESVYRASQSLQNDFQDKNILNNQYKGVSWLYIDILPTFGIQDSSNISFLHIALQDNNRDTKAKNKYTFTLCFGDSVLNTSQFTLVNCSDIANDINVSLGDYSDVIDLDIVLQIVIVLK